MTASTDTRVLETRRALSEDLIGRARALRPLLIEKAPEAEALGQLSPAVVAALAEAELFSLGPPAAVGGHDVDIDTMFEIGYELGRGCMSTAWCWQICTLHSWFSGYVDPRAHQEVYADGPSTVISSGYNPHGAIVELVDGGCMLSGRWGFSSGVDQASWIILGADLPGVERPPGAQTLMMFVPRSEVSVEDDWNVMGLRGTGSKSLVIHEPVFVPEYRYVDVYDGENGPAFGLYDRPSYALPVDTAIAFVVVSPFVGAAQAVVDDFSEDMRSRTDSLTGASKAASASVQMRIGESAADVNAALHMTRSMLREMLAAGASGGKLTSEQRSAYRLASVYDVELARRAVTRLFRISGTAGMFSGSQILRRFLDIYTGSKHFGVRWDEHTESYGRVRLGLEPSSIIR